MTGKGQTVYLKVSTLICGHDILPLSPHFPDRKYDVTCLYLPCREMAVKFNDYFEFPREFDMAPYTAATLAELEGAVTRM